MYAYVKDGKIERFGQLPKVWEMQDGTTVSGFHLLDEDITLAEGWYKVIEDKPEYDEQTHYLTNQTYEVEGDKVVAHYTVEPIPVPEPEQPQLPTIEEQIAERDRQILELKQKQIVVDQMANDNSITQQQLLELLMEMGII